MNLGQKIIGTIKLQFKVNRISVNIGFSVSLYPNHAIQSKMMTKFADTAIYKCKSFPPIHPSLFSYRL